MVSLLEVGIYYAISENGRMITTRGKPNSRIYQCDFDLIENIFNPLLLGRN